MDGKERIRKLLQTLKGEKINICGEIYAVLKEEEQQSAQLLQFFCENAEGINSSGEAEAQEIFTEGETIDYEKSYGKIIDGILEKLLLERPQKEDFYAALWQKITLKELFEDEKTQVFALYYIWMDSRIPYFELPETIHMEREEYGQIVEKLLDKEQKARFILSSDFKQWSEVSYLLLELLNEVEDKKEKAVLLSYIFQLREKMLLSKLMSGIARREKPEEKEQE